MGKGTGEVNEPVRKGNANEKETGRPERADAEAPAGEGRPREEHDTAQGQEEGVDHEEDAGARTVFTKKFCDERFRAFQKTLLIWTMAVLYFPFQDYG
jgi:hypothetical protein